MNSENTNTTAAPQPPLPAPAAPAAQQPSRARWFSIGAVTGAAVTGAAAWFLGRAAGGAAPTTEL